MGLLMLALGSSEAGAQNLPAALNVPAAVRTIDVDQSARPLGTAIRSTSGSATATSAAVVTASGNVLQAQPARTVTVSLQPDVAREAAWLYRSGWPLYALVDRYSAGAELNEEATCLATAVYFEARGESLEGQLAVARVVMNRAASGRYPPSWCETVKQHAQFSFVRHGEFPAINTGSDAWRKAQAITRLAMSNAVPSISNDVLWYHADYVAPTWRRNLQEVSKIGQHIFYRS
jgi:N-acetylmuramoyl-L-alanine amidase